MIIAEKDILASNFECEYNQAYFLHAKTMSDSIWANFTNQYSLSKTLRFELRPIGNTGKMLEDANVFEKDRLIQQKYLKTKPYLDRLHREFIKEALSNAALEGIDDFQESLKEMKADIRNIEKKKAYQKRVEMLRNQILVFFNSHAKKWVLEKFNNIGLKNAGIEFLFEENVFQLLNELYGSELETKIIEETTGKEISIFDSWKGFTGYFIKFFETRKNFYKIDGTSTAIATRIVDQNLKRFCDNLEIYETAKTIIDFSEVEKVFGVHMAEVFNINNYNNCLLQEGIDLYNTILGGKTLKDGEKLKGLNELINQYKQNTGEKIQYFKSLDKQILSKKEKFIEELENDNEFYELLKNFYYLSGVKVQTLKKLIENFVHHNRAYDLTSVYITKEALNTIVRKWTSETEIFERWIYESMKANKVAEAKYEKNDNSYKFPKFVSLLYIQKALETGKFSGNFWKDRYYEIDGFMEKTQWEQFLDILLFEFNSLFERRTFCQDGKEKVVGYNIFRTNLATIIEGEKLSLNKDAKVKIKDYADAVLNIYQIGKYFALEEKRKWVDEYETGDFYENPEFGYKLFYADAYEDIIKSYNTIRNYLTKKPWEAEKKWKLNFENPTLANGWDKNKEPDNYAVILRKEGRYYLGLMNKGFNKIFNDENKSELKSETGDNHYEKMVYKFFPDPAKMLPKVCLSKKGFETFSPSDEIQKIYNNAEFKKGNTFSVLSMQKLIDYYKNCLQKYEGWLGYEFKHLKRTEEYKENVGEFYKNISEDGYKITFQKISADYIEGKNKNGELYLFEIHNKDWNLDKAQNGKSKVSHKNLHTLYFESLFSDENIANNFPMKLNGQAEIFYRPKTSKESLGFKKDKLGKDVIDHKRYNEDKIFFHLPMTVNRTKGDTFKFNMEINNFLANNPDVNIIGVDRGEKHLTYYSVISQEGEILDCGTLNTINGVDYGEKLTVRAEEREQARKDWQDVQAIKDLKKGYISQVVRKLADLAIEYNAIIVFEDLNMRFKQIRGGIEKSVYQQLEKALIEKLNFLVNKGEVDSTRAGHLLKAYQLTAPFETFKDMGKQTGIIFYTQASYTSKIDPISGWRPHLYLKYSSADKAKADILKFTEIKFNSDRFEFTYDIKNFQNLKEFPKNTIWTICSCVERYRWDRTLNQNKGGYVHYQNLTESIGELFTKYGIDFRNGDILGEINRLESKGNEGFYKSFIFFFNLICQIRNTNEQAKDVNKQDFVFSPVVPFFDSREADKFGTSLPKNGDDNGAYNIARKGLVILNKINEFANKNGNCEKLKWGDLYISHTDWDNFAMKN